MSRISLALQAPQICAHFRGALVTQIPVFLKRFTNKLF
jgi:hypothetical protein